MAENIEKEFDGEEFSKVDGVESGQGSDLFLKCRDAIRAGLGAVASQYIAVDKGTISPNSKEKSLTTTGNPDE